MIESFWVQHQPAATIGNIARRMPYSIFVASELAPELLGPITVAPIRTCSGASVFIRR